jgi:hypothetical protein
VCALFSARNFKGLWTPKEVEDVREPGMLNAPSGRGKK